MKYRAEIDGLRALAVVPVILFHAGFELFSGGFVGVDVFFVISGYLITTILIEDIDKKRFSIVNFYERRARRILPALFFVITITTAFGYLFLYPSDLDQYAEALPYVILFFANFYFWKNSDYFSLDAELNPLIHTWSLAVEEQFYLIFPILFVLVWGFGRNTVFWIIVVTAAISLSLSEWGWRSDATANFYLVPTRAWELLTGSIVAFIVLKRSVQKNNILALSGAAAIVFSILFFDQSTPFPSVYSIVPVFGAALILLYADKATLVAKVLSARPFVGIGLISYSAYLWHQPVFSFFRHISSEETSNPKYFLILIVCVALLSIFTWSCVEKPFRSKDKIANKTVGQLSIGMTVTFLIIGYVITASSGATFRINGSGNGYWERAWSNDYEKSVDCNDDSFKSQFCRFSGASDEFDVIVVGDSHAGHLYPGLAKMAAKDDIKYMVYAAGSCHPVVGFEQRDGCAIFSNKAIELINLKKSKVVILAGYHINAASDPQKYVAGYEAFLSRINNDNESKIYLAIDNPAFNFSFKDCRTKQESLPFKAILGLEKDICPDVIERENIKGGWDSYQNKFVFPLLKSNPNLRPLNVRSVFCNDTQCSSSNQDSLLYFGDDNHLSRYGSEKVWSIWLENDLSILNK